MVFLAEQTRRSCARSRRNQCNVIVSVRSAHWFRWKDKFVPCINYSDTHGTFAVLNCSQEQATYSQVIHKQPVPLGK